MYHWPQWGFWLTSINVLLHLNSAALNVVVSLKKWPCYWREKIIFFFCLFAWILLLQNPACFPFLHHEKCIDFSSLLIVHITGLLLNSWQRSFIFLTQHILQHLFVLLLCARCFFGTYTLYWSHFYKLRSVDVLEAVPLQYFFPFLPFPQQFQHLLSRFPIWKLEMKLRKNL